MITDHPLEKIINGPAHHTLHHMFFTVNYGQVRFLLFCPILTLAYHLSFVFPDEYSTSLGPTAWVALTVNLQKNSTQCSKSKQPKPSERKQKTSKDVLESFYLTSILRILKSFIADHYIPRVIVLCHVTHTNVLYRETIL